MSGFKGGYTGRTRISHATVAFSINPGGLYGASQIRYNIGGMKLTIELDHNNAPGLTNHWIGTVSVVSNSFINIEILRFVLPSGGPGYVPSGTVTFDFHARQAITLGPKPGFPLVTQLTALDLPDSVNTCIITVDWNGLEQNAASFGFLPDEVDQTLSGDVHGGTTTISSVLSVDGHTFTHAGASGEDVLMWSDFANGLIVTGHRSRTYTSATGTDNRVLLTGGGKFETDYSRTQFGSSFQYKFENRLIMGEIRSFDELYAETGKLWHIGNSTPTPFFVNGPVAIPFTCELLNPAMGSQPAINTFGYFGLYADEPYFLSNYGDHADYGYGVFDKMPGRAFRWPVMTLSFQNERRLTVDSWEMDGDMDLVSQDSNEVSVHYRSGSIRPFWDDPQQHEAWRYLRFEVRITGENLPDKPPFSLSINKKSWNCKGGGSGEWQSVEVDLCSPNGYSGDVQNQDTRWPIHPHTRKDGSIIYLPRDEDAHWGVNWFGEMFLSGFPKDSGVEIRGLTSFAKSVPTLELLDQQGPRAYNYKGTLNEGKWFYSAARRGVLAIVDGKLALEYPFEEAASGSSTFSPETVRGFVDYVNSTPGWVATLSHYVDPIITGDDTTMDEMCQGAQWDGGAWVDSTEIPINGIVQLYAGIRYHELVVGIAQGELQTGVGYGTETPTTYRFMMHLRGKAWGLAYRGGKAVPDSDPQNQRLFDLKREPDGKLGGESVYQPPPGYFETFAPYATDSSIYDLFTKDGTKIGSLTIVGRRRCRSSPKLPFGGMAVFTGKRSRHLVQVSTDGLSSLRSYHYRIDLATVGKIGDFADVKDISIMEGRDNVISVVFTSGTDAYRFESWDFGVTWQQYPPDGSPWRSNVMRVVNCFNARLKETVEVSQLLDGFLVVRIYDIQGKPLGPLYPEVGNGIGNVAFDDAQISATFDRPRGFIDVGGSVGGVSTVYRSQDDGKTWFKLQSIS